MDRFERFLQVLRSLEKEGVDYKLIGGVAVILHGLPRLTEDIDILVKMDSENILRMKRALHSVFDDPSVEEIQLDDMNTYSVVRYGSPDGFSIDLMARLGDVAEYDTVEFQVIEVQGVTVRMATVQALYDLKKGSLRPKDQNDVMFLKTKIDYQKRLKK